MAEIAEMLGVTRQRADQLSRQVGFPDPIARVVPVDDRTRDALAALFKGRENGYGYSADGTWREFTKRAFELPDQPRLWRREVIEEWMKETGRQPR
jgi:hypothetical protein